MRFPWIRDRLSKPVIGLAILGLFTLVAAFVVLPPLFVLAGTLGLAATIVIMARPIWGIYAIAFTLPFERIGALETAGGTIRASQVLLIITAGAWIVRGLLARRLPLAANPIFLPLMFFLAINVFGLLNAPNLDRSIAVLIFTILSIGACLLTPNLVVDRTILRRTLWALLAGAVVVSLFGLFQFVGDLVGLPTTITGLRDLYTKDVFGFPRIQSTALEPLYFANYLLLPTALAFVFAIRAAGRQRLWWFALLALFGTNLVLTVSRGGYLALAAVLVVIAAFSLRSLLRPSTIISLLVAIILVWVAAVRFLGIGDTFSLNLETFTQHVTNVFFGPSFTERVETIEQARQAWQEHPWIGIGPGSFGPYASVHPFVEPKSGWKIVNNEFIELSAETGTLGLMAIISLFVILILRTVKAIRRSSDPWLKALLLAGLATTIGIVVQYQTFSILYIIHIWFIIGLLIAAQNQSLKPSS